MARVHKPRPHRILGPRQGRTVHLDDIRRAVESEPIPEPYWRPAVRGDCALVPIEGTCTIGAAAHMVELLRRKVHPKIRSSMARESEELWPG